jgi:hypothetical protein
MRKFKISALLSRFPKWFLAITASAVAGLNPASPALASPLPFVVISGFNPPTTLTSVPGQYSSASASERGSRDSIRSNFGIVDTNYNVQTSLFSTNGPAGLFLGWSEQFKNNTSDLRNYSLSFTLGEFDAGGFVDRRSSSQDKAEGLFINRLSLRSKLDPTGTFFTKSETVFQLTRVYSYDGTTAIYSTFDEYGNTTDFSRVTSGSLINEYNTCPISISVGGCFFGFDASQLTIDLGQFAADEAFSLYFDMVGNVNYTEVVCTNPSERCGFSYVTYGSPDTSTTSLRPQDPFFGLTSTIVSSDVPEPGALSLAALGLFGLVTLRQRKAI